MIRRAFPSTATWNWFKKLGRAYVNLIPFIALLLLGLEWNGIPGQPIRDSFAYFSAANQARDSGPIFNTRATEGPHEFEGEWPYLYPPPLAALLSFSPEVDYRTFDRLWLLLNIMAMWIFGAALAKIRNGRWSLRGSMIWTAGVFVTPGAVLAIHFGNLAPVIWALVGIAFAIPSLTGATLASAAAFKVTPAWAWLTLTIRRPRETIVSTLFAAVFMLLACLKAFGLTSMVQLFRQWFSDVLPSVAQGQFWGGSISVLGEGIALRDVLGNVSLSFLPLQLAALSAWGYEGGPLPTPVRAYLLILGVGIPLALLWFLRHKPPRMQAALVLCAAVLLSPIARVFSLPLFLIPFAIHLGSGEGPSKPGELTLGK